MSKDFSHLDQEGKIHMVNVGQKEVSSRRAVAQSLVHLPAEVRSAIDGGDINGPKGPVFETARLAGIMAVKKTSELIPLCHPLTLSGIQVQIQWDEPVVRIECAVECEGKTGVEMEALTGCSVAALTIYDMCKALSHDIRIGDTKLLSKTGGKSDFNRANG